MSQAQPEAVTHLLKQYEDYKQIQQQVSAIEKKLAKAKILGQDTASMAREYQQHRNRLQTLSDEMTFEDPIVWMLYKYYAYKNEAQPITTLHDFRIHCSKQDYICTKRFTFLNDALESRSLATLNDSAYDESIELIDLSQDESLIALLRDESFMKEWNRHEYFKNDGVVAKWQNDA